MDNFDSILNLNLMCDYNDTKHSHQVVIQKTYLDMQKICYSRLNSEYMNSIIILKKNYMAYQCCDNGPALATI